MEMQASKEFLAELKVLTRVHHLNLVHLIGCCVYRSLCLVYEFVENGNLSQHLCSSDTDPLPWLTRVQIALDSARGLQYIHELTIPGYIHRDVKSTNILIDENFRGKVADFGLTVLTELGNTWKPRRAGTFGYMPPVLVSLMTGSNTYIVLEGQGVKAKMERVSYYLHLGNLPLDKLSSPFIDLEAQLKVDDAMSMIDSSTKEAAYHAWLGYHNSIRQIGRDKTMLVELANKFSESIGLQKPPSLFRKTTLKIGLKDIPGIRIRP